MFYSYLFLLMQSHYGRVDKGKGGNILREGGELIDFSKSIQTSAGSLFPDVDTVGGGKAQLLLNHFVTWA